MGGATPRARAVVALHRGFDNVLADSAHAMTIHALYDALYAHDAPDAFKPRLGPGQWSILQSYLTRHEIGRAERLLTQGELDRTMYLLESGTLQVFVDKPRPGQRLSVLHRGAVVGEAGLFSQQPRMANVEAMSDCVVWAMRGPRFEEMAARSPGLALAVVRAAASLMGVRMRANFELGQTMS
jgi:CRP/FNR family transcriptional regulator, cyclic AMP receptor protein